MSHHATSLRRRRLALTLTLAAALTGSVAACGQSAAAPATAASHMAAPDKAAQGQASQIAQLARLAQLDVAAGVPGVIVRVDDGRGPAIEIARQAPWTKADHTLTPNDQFRMGSNTKTMVATVILQLVAEHKLALANPVSKWLPGLIPNGQAITVRMLLNHTSGLFNYTQDPAVLKAFTGRDARQWTPRQLIAAAVKHKPLFAPGKEYSYSNTNYIALGLVAEKATGQSLGNLIQERIARPLGLKNTYLVTGAPRPGNPRLANGYEPDAARIAPLLPPYAPPGSSFAGPTRDGWTDTTWINLSTEWAARRHGLHGQRLGPLPGRADVGQAATPRAAQGDGDHRLGGILHTGPVRPGPGADRNAVRRGLGPRRPGSRLFQLGLRKQHRQPHGLGVHHDHLRPGRAEGRRRHPGPDQRHRMHHARQAHPGDASLIAVRRRLTPTYHQESC